VSIEFRPAVRENVGLLIGLAGGTGSGKTFSALRLAAGICGDKPFAFIDTESRRGLHYADRGARSGSIDHAELRPPFRPSTYAEAIATADKAGYGAIVIDSMSHEWSGDGGVLDWQQEEFERLGGREATKLLSWSAPKQGHKKMVSKLLQSRAHLIFCFRAEPHVEMVKEDGKTKIVPKTGLTGLNGWFPVTEKNLPFELTASFLLMADAPGIPLPIKLTGTAPRALPARSADQRRERPARCRMGCWRRRSDARSNAAASSRGIARGNGRAEGRMGRRSAGADARITEAGARIAEGCGGEG
jgi:hypothetical protein